MLPLLRLFKPTSHLQNIFFPFEFKKTLLNLEISSRPPPTLHTKSSHPSHPPPLATYYFETIQAIFINLTTLQKLAPPMRPFFLHKCLSQDHLSSQTHTFPSTHLSTNHPHHSTTTKAISRLKPY